MKASFAWLGLLLLLPWSAGAAPLDFYRDVYPALKTNCISCHNKTTTKGGLNMESPASLRQGGDTGAGLVAGRSAESLIVQAAAHQEEDMIMPPPNNKSGAVNLTAAELAVLRTWIDEGAADSTPPAREMVWQAPPSHLKPIYAVATTKDGRYAACGRAHEIYVYDLATRQLVARFPAHRAAVQALAFSPDGLLLASGSFGEVKLWRRTPGPASAPAAAPSTPISASLRQQVAAVAKVPVCSEALSADGKLLVTGCEDGLVRVWDASSLKLLQTLRGTVAGARRVAELQWSQEAQNLEQTFHRSEVIRFEAQNKALEELLKKAHATAATLQKALPEKEKLAQESAAAEQAAQAALASLAPPAPPAGEAAAPSPAPTPARKEAEAKLAQATMANTTAQMALAAVKSNLADALADAERIAEAKAKNAAAITTATAAANAAKTQRERLAAELAAEQKAQLLPGARPLAVAFSPQGHTVASYSAEGSLRLWATATGQPLEETVPTALPTPSLIPQADGSFVVRQQVSLSTGAAPTWPLAHTLTSPALRDRVNAVCFSPDGRTLAAGSGEPSRSGDITLWDAASGQLRQTFAERHKDTVLALAFSPDGRRLASGGADKLARITELASGKVVQLFEGHTQYVLGVAFRADGRALATAGGDNVVLTWDLLSGERKKKIEGWNKEVTSLQYLGATAQLVTASGDEVVRIVSDDGTAVRAMPKLADFLQATASTGDGAIIIGGGEASALRVWNRADGKELTVFPAP